MGCSNSKNIDDFDLRSKPQFDATYITGHINNHNPAMTTLFTCSGKYIGPTLVPPMFQQSKPIQIPKPSAPPCEYPTTPYSSPSSPTMAYV
jgi:hypothetical protein